MFFLNKKWNANLLQLGILLLFVCSFLQLNAQKSPDDLWSNANKFYTQHQYDSAIQQYTQLIKDSSNTSSVYYNLGNAFFRSNQYEKAVICYKIAWLKDYGNQKIKDNLDLAKSKVEKPIAEAKPIFFEVWWQRFLHFFSPIIWGLVSLVVFVGILFLWFYNKTSKKSIPYFARWMATAVVLFIVIFILFYQSTKALSNDKVEMQKLEKILNL